MKEFGIHIAIVTIGILIALSLEGIIETVHNGHLVRETRQNFTTELALDHRQAVLELQRDRKIHAALDQLVVELPMLLKTHPEQVRTRLAAIRTAGYFLPAQAWQAALSTGGLALMPPEEVERYSATYFMLHSYSDVQKNGYEADTRAQAFFLSHSPLQPAEFGEGSERIILYDEAAAGMEQVGAQMEAEIRELLPAASGR